MSMARETYSEDSLQYTITSCTKSTVHLKCLWILPNFKELRSKIKEGNWIKSSETLTFFSGTFTCGLCFVPKSKTNFQTPSTALYILKSPNCIEVKPWFLLRIAVKDRDGHFHYEHLFCPIHMTKAGMGTLNFIPCDFPSPESEEKLLPNGCLQIYVEATFWKENCFSLDEKLPFGVSTSITTSSVSFENLLYGNYASDVELYADGKLLKAHKNIISTRSSFLKDMLEKESSNVLSITDVRFDVLKEVLRFMYTDTVTASIKSILGDTLEVADKFGINALKDFCIAEMIDSISYDNVSTYFRASNVSNANELQSKCMDFMIKNKDVLICRMSWKKFKDKNKDLADLLEEMMESGKPI